MWVYLISMHSIGYRSGWDLALEASLPKTSLRYIRSDADCLQSLSILVKGGYMVTMGWQDGSDAIGTAIDKWA